MVVEEGPSRIHVIKDTSLWLGGMLGLGYQTVTGDVNEVLTAAFMAMLGLPGISGIVSILRNTTSSPPPFPPQESSSTSSREVQES